MKFKILFLILLHLILCVNANWFNLFAENKPYVEQNTKHVYINETNKKVARDPIHTKTEDTPYVLKQASSNILHELEFNGSEWECIKSILQRKHYENEINLVKMVISKTTSREISDCYEDNIGLWEKIKNWWSQTSFVVVIKKYWIHIVASAIAIFLFIIILYKIIVVCKLWNNHNDEDII
ncbi:hypothetical protein PVAND_010481 [Polypedilum vanderplanki]|uniref:Uncharacterized protein n=1 Tax=Polypedilum vanderplanki TaxID=319348 RepID=A0A9J6CGK5_POLVA|nr:hypothetical protein PVAND_010481 [Polypedilum vanderplanki]